MATLPARLGVAFETPWLLALIPAALIVVAWMEWRLPGTRMRRTARTLSRTALLGLGLAALAGPYMERRTQTMPQLVVALDQSVLRGANGNAEARAWLKRLRLEAERRATPTQLVLYDDEVRAVQGIEKPLDKASSADKRPTSRLRAGLSAARIAFPDHTSGRVVVLASGRSDTQGVREELSQLAQRNIDVTAVALPMHVEHASTTHVAIDLFDVPERVAGPFAIRTVATTSTPAQAVLTIDGVEFKRLPVPPSSNGHELNFGNVSLPPGLHSLTLRVVGNDDGPSDARERRVHVEGRPTTFVMHARPQASPFVRAWRAYNTAFNVMTPAQLVQLDPRTLPRHATRPLLLADATALSTLSAKETKQLQAALEQGLGLVVEAGSDQDAWDRLSKAPAASLLPRRPLPEPPPPPKPPPPPPTPPEPSRPLEQPNPDKGPGLRAERQPEEARPITVLLLIDRSGSMDGEKFSMALEGARRTAAALSSWDRLGVITFARKARVDLRPRRLSSRGGRSLWAAGLQADGDATDIFGALRKAGELLADPNNATPIQHIILLTDGAQTVGAPIFSPVVRPLGARGVTITAVGIGRGARLRDLREIVHWAAGGSVIAARTAAEIPTILTRDTNVLADRRSQEARAMARMRDAEQERNQPKDPPPTPPEKPLPRKEPIQEPREETPDPASQRAPLQIIQRHEALLGIKPTDLPSVSRPYKSGDVRDGIALMQSGERVALSARREGLGRVLLWNVRSDDAGTLAWKQLGVFLQQLARAARAPAGSFDRAPTLRVIQHPEGSTLDVAWPPGVSLGELTLTWVGPGEQREPLGVIKATRTSTRIALPRLAAGKTARIEATSDAVSAMPALDYRRKTYPPAPERTGNAAVLAEFFGQPPQSASEALEGLLGSSKPRRQPVWMMLVLSMIALLPFDVALHRRSVRR